jgi:hypothetical protein
MRWSITILLLALLCANSTTAIGQKSIVDTIKAVIKTDSIVKAKKIICDTCFSPKKATIRSAMVPGWGQVYNKQVWKVPLIYGTLGTVVGVFAYNLKNYNGLKKAYVLISDTIPSNDVLIANDYKSLSQNSIKFYRDDFRKNVDISVLAFILAWGLNVVDATVSGHLKQFDVGDNLGLKLKPNLGLNGQVGLALIFKLNDKQKTRIGN